MRPGMLGGERRVTTIHDDALARVGESEEVRVRTCGGEDARRMRASGDDALGIRT